MFIVGGSSRSDTQSFSVIRPVTTIVLAYGIWNLKQEHAARYRFLFAFALAVLFLTLIYVIPLPWTVWPNVRGRNLSAEIAGATGIAQVWQPISMAPTATWNALSALLVPITVLIFSSQLDRESSFRIIGVFLIFGLANIILGVLQAIGSSESPIYFYRIRAGNFPSGFFANRNHYAVFLSCMIPMLAVYLSSLKSSSHDNRWKIWIACAFGALVIPLILVTGSRAGLLTAALGILATPFLYRKQLHYWTGNGKKRRFNFFYITGSLGIAALAYITILASRAETFDRLFDDNGSAAARFSIWQPVRDMVETYGALGSGAGTFAPVYQISEPLDLLTFQYVPHAHNDLLEVALTTGWLGIILMGGFAIAFSIAAWRHFRADIYETRDTVFGRLGVVILGLLVVASIVDYPLRVPSLESFFVVAGIWAASNREPRSKRAGGA